MAISRASYYTWLSNAGTTDDPTNEQRIRLIPEANARKIALQLDSELNLSDYFVLIPDVPGGNREIIARLFEGVPLILLVDIQATLNHGIQSSELHTIEPGQNLTIELPHVEGNVTYTGTLINKRVFGSNYGRLMSHRLTIWTHSAMLSDGTVLIWDQGNWDEGDWE